MSKQKIAKLTISEYCQEYGKNKRYVQFLCQNGKLHLLTDVVKIERVGNIYLLAITKQ